MITDTEEIIRIVERAHGLTLTAAQTRELETRLDFAVAFGQTTLDVCVAVSSVADKPCWHLCRRCWEPRAAHCPWCSRCPDQECPAWCEPPEE